jgi:predicted PurR-regulated permease PerM
MVAMDTTPANTASDPQLPPAPTAAPWVEPASLVIAGVALFGTLYLGLLSALLPGLLIYLVVQSAVPLFRHVGVTRRVGKAIVILFIAALISVGVAFGVLELIALMTTGTDNIVALLQQMADVVSTARARAPAWVLPYLPESMQELQSAAATWLRDHAGQIGIVGQGFGRFLFHVLIGMIIGGIIAFHRGQGDVDPHGPLARALTRRMGVLSVAFRNVVFSQIRISALNTVLTGIYLAIVLPALGIQLPLVKTMIAVTFLVGLIPILGNLISNTVIVVVSLSISPYVAAGSLTFLVVIHKLEYFINARIIGSRIKARAWELLTVMMVMEAAFGIPGLIAAPIFYAYVKDELTARRLI